MATDPSPAALPASFYDRPSRQVARDLLGCLLTDGLVTVRLVEVEAYTGTADPASHSYRGPTLRNAVMWGPPGRLYVYFTYGMHWCMNTVCGAEGDASAVLLRAGDVVAGADEAALRRPGVRRIDWARGPARLTRLLGVTGVQNGLDLTAGGPPLTLLPGAPEADDNVRVGPRVGLNPRLGEAAEWPWRWWIADSAAVSTFRPGGQRTRKARSDG
ncbi:MAG TPA: DNA-3-methyladenine glycosylase [Frankiaceae bacterium]|nr:DNA-3-methyladenine glycosylase [Frankiaceae bacterium]